MIIAAITPAMLTSSKTATTMIIVLPSPMTDGYEHINS
jgi:hypothetical protein